MLPMGPELFGHPNPWVRAVRVLGLVTGLASGSVDAMTQLRATPVDLRQTVGVESPQWTMMMMHPVIADPECVAQGVFAGNPFVGETRWMTLAEVERSPAGAVHPLVASMFSSIVRNAAAAATLPWSSRFGPVRGSGAVFQPVPPGPLFSIDVECVADGTGHNDRTPCEIAMVDGEGNPVFHRYIDVRPYVVSYLTEVTGLSEDTLASASAERVSSLERAIADLKAALPPTAVLVGSSVSSDIRWLGLEEGKDFSAAVDLVRVFELPAPAADPSSPGGGRAVRFSLRALALRLLRQTGFQDTSHDPMEDARVSVTLYTRFASTREAWEKAIALLRVSAPTTSKVPASIEGVCMRKYQRNQCTCGQD
jgi:hypothetical protein